MLTCNLNLYPSTFQSHRGHERKPFQKRKPNKKFEGKAPIDPEKLEAHSRGEGVGKGVRHPLHAEKLRKKERKFTYAQDQAARAEILLTEDHG